MVLVVHTLVVLRDGLGSFDFLLHFIYPILNRICCLSCCRLSGVCRNDGRNTLTPYLVVRGSDCHVYTFILIFVLTLGWSVLNGAWWNTVVIFE